MARGKWIDKRTAQHFTLVHRPQNDPLIHDENAPSMVLNPTENKKGDAARKGKHLDDLVSELGADAQSIRANEGEAANYGVYYDDTEYDYMQHLRDLNSAGAGDVVFVESTASGNQNKGKQKQTLDEALKDMEIKDDKSSVALDDDMLPSKNLERTTYESQQAIPDSIAGFQPDMDPRLREALEALEDDAYVDESGEDEDLFKQLTQDGYELEDDEFEQAGQFADEDGWESDDTAKPAKEYRNGDDAVPDLVSGDDVPQQRQHPDEGPGEDWLEEFKQFRKDQKTNKAGAGLVSHSGMESMWTTTTNGGKRKKRKGALTDTSSYSMTSSSIMRTDQMTLLDSRFDKIDEKYNEDMDDMASVSAASTVSTVGGPVRGDFDGILDDFLGNYTKPGKRTNKKNRPQTGLEQLDEIRSGLGPARFIKGRPSR
ncbi:protein LTV1 [Geosmithia morbida]|uniref:Protein LTV1 n=1 Tax=Geosmithia morbida TaxID=1094350 RepID=A0A9P5CYR7_9HYPO|nr:protein LTV1 [Geosmithia morbida]KAF4119687.1 protein LTV1 [Geosmithia morbida]